MDSPTRLPIADGFDYEWYLTMLFNNVAQGRGGSVLPVEIRVSPEFFVGYKETVYVRDVIEGSDDMKAWALNCKTAKLYADASLRGLEVRWKTPEAVV